MSSAVSKRLFGGSTNTNASNSSSGYGSLPAELQKYFTDIAQQGSNLVGNASQYFAPQGINSYEDIAGQMILPGNIGQGIAEYLNPFTDYLTSNINKSFEDQFGAQKQQASEAGAFGGSRYRKSMADLEQGRLGAIGSTLADQYNNATNQYQQGISNLLGFGGLQRDVDLAQRQALPTALSFFSNLINPLLGGSTSSSYGRGNSETGIITGIGNFLGNISPKAPTTGR